MAETFERLSPDKLVEIYRKIEDVLALYADDGIYQKELSLIAHYKDIIIHVLELQALFGTAMHAHLDGQIGDTGIRLRSGIQAKKLGMALKNGGKDIFALVGAEHLPHLITSLKDSDAYGDINKELVIFDPGKLTPADAHNNPQMIEIIKERLSKVIAKVAELDNSIRLSVF